VGGKGGGLWGRGTWEAEDLVFYGGGSRRAQGFKRITPLLLAKEGEGTLRGGPRKRGYFRPSLKSACAKERENDSMRAALAGPELSGLAGQ